MAFLKKNTRKLLLIFFCLVGCILCAIGVKNNIAEIHKLRQMQAKLATPQIQTVIIEKPVVVEPETVYFDIPLSRDIQDHIFAECEKHNIQPAIIVAMIYQESKFDAYALGDDGRSAGLMQVQAKWHLQRMIELGCTDLFNPYQNITVGVDILAEQRNRYGGAMDKALTAYNRGSFSGTVTNYAKEILTNAMEVK